jgi:hypothetical protein
MKISLALFLLTFNFLQILNAQDLHLISGNKTKTIKAGTYIEVELVASPEACVKCPRTAIGQLISYTNGQVNLRTSGVMEPLVGDESGCGEMIKRYKKSNMPVLSFSKQDILSIKIKGKNKIQKTTTGKVLGEVLVFMGLTNMISSPLARIEDHEAGNLLLKLGAAEFLAGVIMTEVFDQRVFYMSQNSRQKGNGNKIWDLN